MGLDMTMPRPKGSPNKPKGHLSEYLKERDGYRPMGLTIPENVKALHHAIERGDVKGLKDIISLNSLDILYKVDYFGRNAMSAAYLYGDRKIIEVLREVIHGALGNLSSNARPTFAPATAVKKNPRLLGDARERQNAAARQYYRDKQTKLGRTIKYKVP